MPDLDTIMAQLDDWVIFHKTGYLTLDCSLGPSTPQSYAIEQVREEIKEFINVILSNKRFDNALEVGLGYWGGTHFLWRLMFNYVSTIEHSKRRISMYIKNCEEYYKERLMSGHNLFFSGLSYHPQVATAVYKRIPPQSLDLLFIDGGHFYEEVSLDWILYHHLVAQGGIVAFHDFLALDAGVGRFVKELFEGTIDGIKRNIKCIAYSTDRGIAYYVQGEQA